MGEGDPAGGSLSLATLVDRHGEDLIPDLKHYYGIDLRDLFSEDHPLSPSWALLHTHNLPARVGHRRAMRGGEEFRGWGPDRYMVARMIDQLSALRYILLLANRDPKKQPPKPPEMYPLPDHKTKQSKQARDAQPGSFASIANGLLAKGKKRKEGGG